MELLSQEEIGRVNRNCCQSFNGAIEHIPVVRVTNIARTIDELKEKGYGLLEQMQKEQWITEKLMVNYRLL